MSSLSFIEEAEEHFTAIGKLCAMWALLDRELNKLLSALLSTESRQIAAIATQIDSVAGRCRLAKQLLYTIPGQQWWRDEVEKLIHIIEQNIAPKRNRYVHDSWSVNDEKRWIKIDRRASLEKIQILGTKILNYDAIENVSTDDIYNLRTNITVAMICLSNAIDDIGSYSKLETMRKEESLLLSEGYMEMFQNL